MGCDVSPEGPDVFPVHESFGLVAVQDSTFSTFQNTFLTPPLRTSCGRIWRWPVLLPDLMNVMGGIRQMEDPAEQNAGEAHVAYGFVTVSPHDASVVIRTISWSEHE
jgi:hypothetical protein